MGLKTHLNSLKGIFVQKGSSGTRFDHGQFEIETFPTSTPLCFSTSYNASVQWNVDLT